MMSDGFRMISGASDAPHRFGSGRGLFVAETQMLRGAKSAAQALGSELPAL